MSSQYVLSIDKLLSWREESGNEIQNFRDILLQAVDDGIRSRVICVRGLGTKSSRFTGSVVFDNESDDGTAHVIHVEDGRFGVEANCVERIGVRHRDLGESSEVTITNGFGDVFHPLGYDNIDAMLEKGRSFDGPLHAGGGAGSFLMVRDDADDGVHLGPVISWSNLDGKTVRSIRICTSLPGNESAEE